MGNVISLPEIRTRRADGEQCVRAARVVSEADGIALQAIQDLKTACRLLDRLDGASECDVEDLTGGALKVVRKLRLRVVGALHALRVQRSVLRSRSTRVDAP